MCACILFPIPFFLVFESKRYKTRLWPSYIPHCLLQLRLWRLSTRRFLRVSVDFHCVLGHLAISRSGSSESTCCIEPVASNSFQFLSELMGPSSSPPTLVLSSPTLCLMPIPISDHPLKCGTSRCYKPSILEKCCNLCDLSSLVKISIIFRSV